jgi:hypothetical protein
MVLLLGEDWGPMGEYLYFYFFVFTSTFYYFWYISNSLLMGTLNCVHMWGWGGERFPSNNSRSSSSSSRGARGNGEVMLSPWLRGGTRNIEVVTIPTTRGRAIMGRKYPHVCSRLAVSFWHSFERCGGGQLEWSQWGDHRCLCRYCTKVTPTYEVVCSSRSC